MAKKSMSKKGPSSRKGDPNWKPRKLSIDSSKVALPRDARSLVPPKGKIEQNKLGEEMVEWAFKHSLGFSINDFPLEKRYNPYDFFNIAKKNETFARCLDMARYIILSGMNKANLADSTTYTMRQHAEKERWWDKHFAAHYKEMIELRKTKNEDDDKNARIVYKEVLLNKPHFGTSGMVPDKPKEEDED